MKKLAIISLFAMAVSFTSNAQLTIGAKAGYNTSKIQDSKINIHLDDGDVFSFDTDFKYKSGFHVGGVFNYELNRRFDVQAELLYSMQGYKQKVADLVDFGGNTYAEVECKVTTHYLNIPLLLRLKGNPLGSSALFFEFGPQLGIYLGNHYTFEPDEIYDNSLRIKTIKPVTLSLAGGIGCRYDCGISVSARFTQGITNMMKHIDKSKSHALEISVAYDIVTF